MSNFIIRTGLRGLMLIGIVAGLGFHTSPALAATSAPSLQIFNAGAAIGSQNNLHLGQGAKQLSCGVQFTGSIPANATQLYFTFDWAAASYIDWTVMSDSVYSSGSEVTLSNVATQRADSTHATYWLTVVNNTSSTQTFDGRFCILH